MSYRPFAQRAAQLAEDGRPNRVVPSLDWGV